MLPFHQPLAVPRADQTSHPRVEIRHPAYPDATPALLRLHAVDDGGVDYDTAFVACAIITGNTWSRAWLARRRPADAGPADLRLLRQLERVERPPDGVLRDRVYYFVVGDEGPTPAKYPVLPCFDHWRFPHEGMPAPWSALAVPPAASPPTVLKQKVAAVARDASCRITGYSDGTEVAHLVPVAAGNWFKSNKMEEYCRIDFSYVAIDDQKNLIVLRKDLHYLLDTRRLVLATKRPPDDAPPQLVIHILLPDASSQLIPLYHNRLPQAITEVAPQFLFARFAWSIFADENMPFFQSRSTTYAVLLFDPTTGHTASEILQGRAVPRRAQIFDSVSTSRSVSPR